MLLMNGIEVSLCWNELEITHFQYWIAPLVVL